MAEGKKDDFNRDWDRQIMKIFHFFSQIGIFYENFSSFIEEKGEKKVHLSLFLKNKIKWK